MNRFATRTAAPQTRSTARVLPLFCLVVLLAASSAAFHYHDGSADADGPCATCHHQQASLLPKLPQHAMELVPSSRVESAKRRTAPLQAAQYAQPLRGPPVDIECL